MIIYNEEKKELIIPTGIGNIDNTIYYDEGFTDGYSSGRTDGYHEGYGIGYGNGFDDGHESGYTAGKADGLEEGYNSAYTQYQRAVYIYMYLENEIYHQGGVILGNIYINGRLCTNSEGHLSGREINMTARTCDTRLNTLSFIYPGILTEVTSVSINDMYRDIVSQEEQVVDEYHRMYTLTFNNERIGDTWSYHQGYEQGTQRGYETGYERGWQQGHNSGFTDGYASGWNDGHESGLTEGYANGFNDGHESGYTDGYADGYASGFTDGYNSGQTKGIVFDFPLDVPHVLDYITVSDFYINGVYSPVEWSALFFTTPHLWISGFTYSETITGLSFTVVGLPHGDFPETLGNPKINDCATVEIASQNRELLAETEAYKAYKYTLTFNDAPVYDKRSYEAGLAACQNNENQ